MNKPTSHYPVYYQRYLDLVPSDQTIFSALHEQHMDTIDLITSLDDETLQSAYAPGKWTIMEVIGHIMDTERILCHRAFTIARGDQSVLPSFSQDLYVSNSRMQNRKILGVVKEFSLIRANTIEMFSQFDEQMTQEIGNSNGHEIIVSALAYMICGHEIHHRSVIEKLYIGAL